MVTSVLQSEATESYMGCWCWEGGVTQSSEPANIRTGTVIFAAAPIAEGLVLAAAWFTTAVMDESDAAVSDVIAVGIYRHHETVAV